MTIESIAIGHLALEPEGSTIPAGERSEKMSAHPCVGGASRWVLRVGGAAVLLLLVAYGGFFGAPRCGIPLTGPTLLLSALCAGLGSAALLAFIVLARTVALDTTQSAETES